MSYIQPTLSQSIIDDITTYVNNYRAKNQSAPMVWDSSISSFSQQWSYYLATNNLFQHSGSSNYGENLALFQGYGNDASALFKNAIDMWYNENVDYNFNNPEFSSATGHFTCLVWKSSTKFGMGISINSITNTAYITFNTAPPGNVYGKFKENVLPILSSPLPSPVPSPVPIPSPTPIPSPITPPTINNNGIIMTLYSIITGIRQNKSNKVILYYLNTIIAQLYSYGSTTTDIINSLYNAIYSIQSKQSKALTIMQINQAIQLLHTL
jgi:hypothetical protein